MLIEKSQPMIADKHDYKLILKYFVATAFDYIFLFSGLMAPEAYTHENALEGWVLRECDEKIRLRAAEAYNYNLQQFVHEDMNQK